MFSFAHQWEFSSHFLHSTMSLSIIHRVFSLCKAILCHSFSYFPINGHLNSSLNHPMTILSSQSLTSMTSLLTWDERTCPAQLPINPSLESTIRSTCAVSITYLGSPFLVWNAMTKMCSVKQRWKSEPNWIRLWSSNVDVKEATAVYPHYRRTIYAPCSHFTLLHYLDIDKLLDAIVITTCSTECSITFPFKSLRIS